MKMKPKGSKGLLKISLLGMSVSVINQDNDDSYALHRRFEDMHRAGL